MLFRSVKGREEGVYVGLTCVEMPETRFDDILIINPMGNKKMWVGIDLEYIHVCEEGSIRAISYVPSEPCVCGIKVKGSQLFVQIQGNVPEELVIKLSGIRKGKKDLRFEEFTQEQADRNNNFWTSWKK